MEAVMEVSLFRQRDTILFFSCDKTLNLLLQGRHMKGGSLCLSREWRCSLELNGLVSFAVKLLSSSVRFLYWTKFRVEITPWWKNCGFRLVFDPLIFYIENLFMLVCSHKFLLYTFTQFLIPDLLVFGCLVTFVIFRRSRDYRVVFFMALVYFLKCQWIQNNVF